MNDILQSILGMIVGVGIILFMKNMINLSEYRKFKKEVEKK